MESTSTATQQWTVVADRELPDLPGELIQQIEREKLDKPSVKAILEEFEMRVSLADVAEHARSIVVTDASQTDLMRQAHDLRIELRDERLRIDKIRETVKKPYLLKTQAIDGISRILRRQFESVEKHLLEQETFVERRRREAEEALQTERSGKLLEFAYEGNTSGLGTMAESQFELLLGGAKATFNEKLEDAQRRTREREEQMERERLLRIENDRLRREKEESDRVAREAQAEADRQRQETERKERERVEAEAAQNRRIADEKAKAAAAPDKDKLTAFADAIAAVELPSLISPDAQKLIERIAHDRDTLVARIKAEAESLRFADVPF